MDLNEQCNHAIEKYYPEILRHCTYLLGGDVFGAEDCTQEVFFLLHQKKYKLIFDKNIRGWLYAASERIVMNYKRKQKRCQPMQPSEMDEIADGFSFLDKPFQSDAFDDLTDDELRLLEDYYASKQGDREAVAEKYGMTVKQLYKKIHVLRENIRKRKQG